jgi:mono/diheme cytochrome c family protein
MRRASLRLSVALCATVAVLAACHSGSSSSTPKPAGDGAANKVPAKPAAVTPANIAMGDSLFNNGSCARCHGKMGAGAANAPALTGVKWLQLKTGSFEEIVGIITSGVPAANIKDPTHKNPMGARGGRMALTDPQIQAVAAYVYTLTHK